MWVVPRATAEQVAFGKQWEAMGGAKVARGTGPPTRDAQVATEREAKQWKAMAGAVKKTMCHIHTAH